MRGCQVVVWLDNWYKRSYGTTPGQTDKSLNVSVMGVLHTEALSPFPGYPQLQALFASLPSVVRRLQAAYARVHDGAALVASEEVDPTWIRVPLDIQRTDMRSLQWLPYLLTDQIVGSQKDLLGILGDLAMLRTQTGRVLPLLVDMDVHYRVMKILYGVSTSPWDYATTIARTPVLYGV